MARNGDRYRVGCAGSGYCSRRRGLADRLCYCGVGTRCPERNGLQLRPHTSLKGGCLNIQWKLGIQTLATHLAKQVFFPVLHGSVVAPPDGEWKLVSQSLLKFRVGVSELDRTNPLVGGRD